MKRDNLFLKYWYIWSMLIAILLPLGLYGLIQQPWGYDAIGKEDAPSVWLGFWGGYIGSIITSAVAIIILYSQLNANHKENEETREDNEQQNEANRIANVLQNEENRKLQLKTIQYQQRMQWLNDFKKVAAEYIMVFNNNNLVVAQNNIISQPEESYRITKKILDDLQVARITMDLYKETDETAETLMNELNAKYKLFSDVVGDIHNLSVFQINTVAIRITNSPQSPNLRNYIVDPNNKFSEQIIEIVESEQGILGKSSVDNLIKKRRKSVETILKDVSELFSTYTQEEQQRINNILLQ